jgi:hypothetical protein
MRTAVLVAFIVGVAALQLGCGEPAIGTLKTITLSSASTNLAGEGGTVQLSATGNYSTGAKSDLSNRVAFDITPVGADDNGRALPKAVTSTCDMAQGCGTVTLNLTGLVTAVPPFVCSWVDTNPSGTASWFISGSYKIVATYHGVSSQPVFVTLASAASSTNPKGNCGP